MARVNSDDQLGFDEEVIENPDVEAALVERQARKDALASVRHEYDEAHEKAKAALLMLELPEDGAVRIGRFRVTKTLRSARSVAFETKASSQLRITFMGDDGEAAATDRDAEHTLAGLPTPIRPNGGDQTSAPH